MTPLTTLLISDRKPGHYNLSEGVLAAAARLRKLEIHRIEVRRPVWLTPRMLWRLSESGLSPALILGYAYGIDATALPKAHLVVSAGGDTLAANVAASRLLGAANIFYGSLRRYAPENFSLVLTSYARNADKPHHAMTLKPSRLDPDTLPALPAKSANGPRTAGLLIGGDAGTVRYTPQDWSMLLTFLEAAHRAHATRWIVANSPRTPSSISDTIARRATDPAGPIAQFIDVRQAGTGTLQSLFAAAEAVAVTADSSSMVSEAVWSRRPAVALSPAGMALPADEVAYRLHLADNGWIGAIDIPQLTPQGFLAALATLRPLAHNPLDMLALTLRPVVDRLA